MPTGYSLGAMADLLYPSRVNTPLSGNLNDYWGLDNRGTWYQSSNASATIALNYPTTQSGVLEVIPHNANFAGASIQRYTVYSNNYVYNRSQASGPAPGVWTPWRLQLNDLNLYNVIYPIGIGIWFSQAVNPNTVFAGTTWVQIQNGRSVRMATSGLANPAIAGQIGNSAGADTVTLVAANLPSHSHSMAHTHTINHTHSNGTATSSGAHTHTVSGSAASSGAHQHNFRRGWSWYGSTAAGNKTLFEGATAGGIAALDWGPGGDSNGAHTHTISGTAASSGAHTHVVTVPAFNGDTGYSSAASTGSVGSGTSFAATGVYIYQAYWVRTA